MTNPTVHQRLKAAEDALMAVVQSANLWHSWLPPSTVAQIRAALGNRLTQWEAHREAEHLKLLDKAMEALHLKEKR